MSTFFVKNNQVTEKSIEIIDEDVNHIKNVLRYKIDDEIDVCDENGTRYKTKIEKFEKDSIMLEIIEKSIKNTECSLNITLFQGLPKADKMDLITQKCTELGIKEIIPFISERVIVKLDDKSETKKQERWQKIAKEAAKQSGRQIVPNIKKTINLKNIIENLSKYDIVIVPYECEKEHNIKSILKESKKDIKNIAIVIGPEGGFSENDIKILEEAKNVKKVSLGPRILRTETAGIATLAMVIYELDY